MSFTKNTVQDTILSSRAGMHAFRYGDMPVGGGVTAEAYISNTYARHRFPAASLSAFTPVMFASPVGVLLPNNNQLFNIIMLKKTISYETPDMKVFEMHPESGMLTVTSPIYGDPGEAGPSGEIIIGGEDY